MRKFKVGEILNLQIGHWHGLPEGSRLVLEIRTAAGFGVMDLKFTVDEAGKFFTRGEAVQAEVMRVFPVNRKRKKS